MRLTPLNSKLWWLLHATDLTWLVVELKKDFVEQGLRPVSCIPWGKKSYEPRCWPNDLWPWTSVENPKQRHKIPPPNGYKKVDVFKQYVRNRLKLKGIEPATHISESYTKEKERAKMQYRGYSYKLPKEDWGGCHSQKEVRAKINLIKLVFKKRWHLDSSPCISTCQKMRIFESIWETGLP